MTSPFRYDYNSDGFRSDPDKPIALFGAAPIKQQAGATQAALAAAGAAYNQPAQQALIDQVTAMRATLIAFGLWKGSA